ncbi:hypothetical protein [Natronococcus pandeyae]|uniref:hypothetical protein n=1 Tax=Natronococcus pandeyae TaxID=2055836 RepID=UPI0011E708DC|nr:hypothetical protein [Natronococcus pandeyae]
MIRLAKIGINKARTEGVLSLFRDGRREILGRGYERGLNSFPSISQRIIRLHTDIRCGFTDADPFKVIEVSPDEITHVSELSPNLYGCVCQGNWDRKGGSFKKKNQTYEAIRSYLFDDDPSLLREHYKSKLMHPRGRPWGHNSIETFDDRLQEIQTLHNSINSDGYLSQQELMDRDQSSTDNLNNEPVPTELNEVTVDIGRNGEMLWTNFGAHRLSIAKLLDVDSIPVVVAARHLGWQKKRWILANLTDQKETTSSLAEYTTHPDLHDLLVEK